MEAPKTCPTCGARWVKRTGTLKTLVGYSSPPGHDHDDNCLSRVYQCEAGHALGMNIRRSCPADGCGWLGSETCFTGHHNPKYDAWPSPDVPVVRGVMESAD